MKTISRHLTASQTLIQYMRIRNYTLEQIAETADISISTLRKIAFGKTKNPTLRTYGKLNHFYCCLLLNEITKKGENSPC